MSPKRIQMSRQHPWRADSPDAVIVARPSRWGNPFKIGGEYILSGFFGDGVGVLTIHDRKEAAGAFNDWIRGEYFVPDFQSRRDWIMEHLDALEGRDLACWCPLGLPSDGFHQCHAEVYLDVLAPVSPPQEGRGS